MTLNSRVTDKPVALEFQVELEFRNVSFWGGKKNRSTRRKTLGARTRTNNTLNPHMTPSPGIEPGPHWWEASALTTAPSLLVAIWLALSRGAIYSRIALLFALNRIFFSQPIRKEHLQGLFKLIKLQEKSFCFAYKMRFKSVSGYAAFFANRLLDQ